MCLIAIARRRFSNSLWAVGILICWDRCTKSWSRMLVSLSRIWLPKSTFSHQIHRTLEQFSRTQVPTMIASLAEILYAVNQTNGAVHARRDKSKNPCTLAKFRGTKRSVPTTRARSHTPEAGIDQSALKAISRHIDYLLPFGILRIAYGYAVGGSNSTPTSSESLALYGKWEFYPAPWLPRKSFITQAMVLMQYGDEYVRLKITWNLTAAVVLSSDPPVWKCWG